MVLRFTNGHGCVRNNNDHITHFSFSRGRAIQATDARPSFSFDEIGFDAPTVVAIDDVNFFMFGHSRGIHKVFIKRETSDIAEGYFGNDSVMHF